MVPCRGDYSQGFVGRAGRGDAPLDALTVMDHSLDGHGLGRLVPEFHHGHRVTDEDNVDPRPRHVDGGRIVVGGDHGDLVSVTFLARQRQG